MSMETTMEGMARTRRDDRLRAAAEQRLVRRARARRALFNR